MKFIILAIVVACVCAINNEALQAPAGAPAVALSGMDHNLLCFGLCVAALFLY